MIEIAVVGEGPAEETFFRDVLGPALAYRQIFVQPRLIPTSRHGRGGALSRDRVLRYLRNTLRERQDLYVATFFDLYALATDFPGWSDPDWKSAAARLRSIRTAVASPEHIDEGPQTHPSARLDALLRPRFRKVLHGPRAATQIGIEWIRAECRHFGEWLARVEGLGPLKT